MKYIGVLIETSALPPRASPGGSRPAPRPSVTATGVRRGTRDEPAALPPRGRLEVIENGADFEDFAGLVYRASDRFRITHTGSFFGRRDPRPFLEALVRSAPHRLARF